MSVRLLIPCIFCTYCNKVTNGCSCLFCVFISFIFTLHVSGFHKPIIRGISSCFLYTTIWFIWCLLLICVCLWTGLSWWFHCPRLHVLLNQMAAIVLCSLHLMLLYSYVCLFGVDEFWVVHTMHLLYVLQ